MKANRVLAVTFALVLSILAACTAPPAVPTSPPALLAAPTATPVPPIATPVPPAASPVPATPAPALPTPLPELMDTVKAYEAAPNRGDIAGIAALFPEQFLDDSISAVNQKQLADGYASKAAQHASIQLEDCGGSQANQIKCSMTYWDDCQKTFGTPFTASLVFTFIDKKIKLLNVSAVQSSEVQAKMDQWWLGLTQWIRQERPAQRAKIFTGVHGDPIDNAETGAIWTQLCQEYAATLK